MKQWDTTDGAANATKGFMMPRVSLTTATSLSDIVTVNPNNATTKQVHTGLTVYNVNAAYTGGIGVNMWDGEKWINVSKKEVPVIKSFLMSKATNNSTLLNLSLTILSGWTALNYPSETVDVNSNYTGGVFIAPRTGTYTINASVFVSTTLSLSVASTISIGIFKKPSGTGTTYSNLASHTANLGVLGLSLGVNPEVGTAVVWRGTLNANDQVAIGYQRSGATVSVNKTDAVNSYLTIVEE